MSSYRVLFRGLSSALLLTLAACGGGGGGGGSATSSETSGGGSGSVAVGPRAYTVTTHHDAYRRPTVAIPYTLGSLPASGIAIGIESPDDLVVDAANEDVSVLSGRIVVTLAEGPAVGAGVHQANVRLSFCKDDACSRHLSGSPVDVTLIYDVRSEDRKVRVEVTNPATAYGLLADAQGPQGAVQVRVMNPPAEGLSVRLAGNDVADGGAGAATVDGYRLAVQYRTPSRIGIGHHTADPRLETCFAQQCGIYGEVGNLRVPLEYIVTAAPTATQRVSSVSAEDYAWDPVRNWIIFLPSGGNGANRGVLDPVTGGVYLEPTGGMTMRHLALSPDGEWLVAGNGWRLERYSRHDLSLVSSATIYNVPGDSSSGVATITDLRYGPDGTLALLSSASGPVSSVPGQGNRLRLLDGVVTRPVSYEPTSPALERRICAATWLDDPSRLIVSAGYDGMVPLSATTSGLEAGAPLPGNVYPGVPSPAYSCKRGLEYAAGRLFDDDGFVFLASDGTVERILVDDEPSAPRDVRETLVDQANRRVLVLHRVATDEAGDLRVTAYSIDTLQKLDSVVILDAAEATNMIRWGTRGLAMRNQYGKLLLIESRVVGGG